MSGLAIAADGSLLLDELDLGIQAAVGGAGLAWLLTTGLRITSRAEL